MTQVRSNTLHLNGTIENRVDASAHLRRAGDAVLVNRGRLRLLILICPCGCGEELTLNLDRRAGPAWRLYLGEAGASLFPSVWRETGCQSHFIIWRDQIFALGQARDELPDTLLDTHNKALVDAVLDQLRDGRLTTYSEVADAILEVPWDVLIACRRLVARGLAVEGTGHERASFRRLDSS